MNCNSSTESKRGRGAISNMSNHRTIDPPKGDSDSTANGQDVCSTNVDEKGTQFQKSYLQAVKKELNLDTIPKTRRKVDGRDWPENQAIRIEAEKDHENDKSPIYAKMQLRPDWQSPTHASMDVKFPLTSSTDSLLNPIHTHTPVPPKIDITSALASTKWIDDAFRTTCSCSCRCTFLEDDILELLYYSHIYDRRYVCESCYFTFKVKNPEFKLNENPYLVRPGSLEEHKRAAEQEVFRMYHDHKVAGQLDRIRADLLELSERVPQNREYIDTQIDQRPRKRVKEHLCTWTNITIMITMVLMVIALTFSAVNELQARAKVAATSIQVTENNVEIIDPYYPQYKYKEKMQLPTIFIRSGHDLIRSNNDTERVVRQITISDVADKNDTSSYDFNYIAKGRRMLNIESADPETYISNNALFLTKHGFSARVEDYLFSPNSAIYIEVYDQTPVDNPVIYHEPDNLQRIEDGDIEWKKGFDRDNINTTRGYVSVVYSDLVNAMAGIGSFIEPKRESSIETAIRERRDKSNNTTPLEYILDDSDWHKSRNNLPLMRRRREYDPQLKDDESMKPDVASLHKLTNYRRKHIVNTLNQMFTPNQREAILTRADKHSFIGYDCEQPQKIPKPVSGFIKDSCGAVNEDDYEFDLPSNVSEYQIVQQRDNRVVDGYRCNVRFTKTVTYCGMHGHTSSISKLNRYAEPDPMTGKVCQDMVKYGIYYDKRGNPHKIAMGKELVVSYYYTGAEWFTESGTSQCQGDKLLIGGKLLENYVEHHRLRIRMLKRQIVKRKDGSVVVKEDMIRLPTDFGAGYSVALDYTYVWEVDHDYCPLAVTRQVKGQILSVNKGSEKIFTTTDHSGIRLVLGAEVIRCKSRMVYATNYPSIYLYAMYDKGKPKLTPFTTTLDPLKEGNVKYHVYLANRADAIYHKLTASVRREFVSTKKDECRRQHRLEKLEHYVSRLEPTVASFSYGSNIFVTTAGEVEYYIVCATRIVTAIDSDKCFDALPVEVIGQNSTLNGPAAAVEWPKLYIEPLTHRLITVSTPIPCTPGLYARYRDIRGEWIEITPRVINTADPEPRQIETLTDLELESTNDPTFSTRNMGIYSPEDMEAMHQHLEFPGLQNAVLRRMASQAVGLTPGQYISPGVVFPDHILPYQSWAGFVLGPFVAFLKKMGDITAVLLFLYYVIRWTYFFWTTFTACNHFHTLHGCTRSMLLALCPTYHYTRQMRNNHRDFNVGEDEYVHALATGKRLPSEHYENVVSRHPQGDPVQSIRQNMIQNVRGIIDRHMRKTANAPATELDDLGRPRIYPTVPRYQYEARAPERRSDAQEGPYDEPAKPSFDTPEGYQR